MSPGGDWPRPAPAAALLLAGLALGAGVAPSGETPRSGTGVDSLHPPLVTVWPTESARDDLRRTMGGPGRLTVLVFPEPGMASEVYADLLRQRTGRRTISSLRFVTPEKATTEDLAGPLLVVGSSATSAGAYLATTPYPLAEAPAPGEALRVASVNPWSPSSPMVVVTGGDGASVHAFLMSNASFRSWDYELVRAGMRVRYGRFIASGGERWRVDPSSEVDLRGRLRRVEEGPVAVVYLEGEFDAARGRAVAHRTLEDLGQYVTILGGASPLPHVELHLYPDLETKGVRTADPRPSHLVPSFTAGPVRIHAIEPAGSAPGPDHRLALARTAIRSVFGELKPKAVADGAALVLAGGMLGQDLDWWDRRLSGSGIWPSAEDLLGDPVGPERSYLVAMPAAAILLKRASARDGSGGLGALLRSPDLRRSLSAARAAGVPSSPAGRTRAADLAPGPFQKGMGLSHEGYAVVDGYGSRSAAEQMKRLREMGVGWIAVSPYAFMNDPHSETIHFQSSEEQGAGGENDQAVLATMADAHRLGLKVMLKPQIWLPRTHWSGEVAMPTEPAWKAFFARYRQFLAHYAILAEAGGADLLSIGVEMEGTTGRLAEWRDLIATARSLYDGPLTYAANWGSEFESISFWTYLDFAGLDCYYPLSGKSEPTDEELLAGARATADRAERISRLSGRPVLLTEVGFPALAGAWISPHDETTGRGEDAHAQARGYRAVLAAFWDRPWLAGIYWWKWPTTPSGSGDEPQFSPRGRPAERILLEWYGSERRPAANWPSHLP